MSHRGKASGQAVLESRISAEDEMSPRANSAELLLLCSLEPQESCPCSLLESYGANRAKTLS